MRRVSGEARHVVRRLAAAVAPRPPGGGLTSRVELSQSSSEATSETTSARCRGIRRRGCTAEKVPYADMRRKRIAYTIELAEITGCTRKSGRHKKSAWQGKMVT